jgi:Bacterial SH3 domain
VRVRRAARRSAAALLLAGLLAQVTHADSMYVIEQLVVNVNSAPDASGERIATVKSGDKLEVIERRGDQVHVRLGGERDGWIRASYLSADEPLRVRLAERDAQLAQLQEELGKLQAQPPAARASAPVAAAASEPAAAAAETGSSAPVGMFAPAEDPPRRVWPWALAALGGGLVLGFVSGALVLDRYIRRKFGGLRIY